MRMWLFFYSIEMDTFPNMTKINRKSMPTIEAGVPPDFLMFLEDIPCRRLSLAWKPEKNQSTQFRGFYDQWGREKDPINHRIQTS